MSGTVRSDVVRASEQPGCTYYADTRRYERAREVDANEAKENEMLRIEEESWLVSYVVITLIQRCNLQSALLK